MTSYSPLTWSHGDRIYPLDLSRSLYLTHQLSPQSFDGSGCLTLDLVRCRLSARAVGLIYN